MPDLDTALRWFLDRVPTVVTVLLLLGAGWLLARLARGGVRRASALLGASSDGPWARIVAVVAGLAFWLVLLAFVLVAVQVGREAGAVIWFDRLGEFVPRLFGGIAILVGGTLLSMVARDFALRWLSQLGVEQAHGLARLLQLAVLVTAFVVSIEQLGIETTFLVTMIAIVAGGIVFAVGLAFAIGAADLVRNLVAARDARRHYAPGQRIRVGETEGELVEITASVLVLATQGGRVTVPARVFHESVVTLLEAAPPDA